MLSQRKNFILVIASITIIIVFVTRNFFLMRTQSPLLLQQGIDQPGCPPHPAASTGATTDAIQNWEDGIDYEVDHHTKWIRGEVATEGWYGYERETKLQALPIDIHQKNICKLFSEVYGSDTTNQVKLMLDHGAGPFTNLGARFNCNYDGAPPDVKDVVDIQVVAVDPLAPRYHEILTNAKVFNTLRSAYCPSEELTKCLGLNTVDFAIIINALDHSKSPVSAFLESLKAVRVGGISCVFTLEREAEHMQGAGFHQWNFYLNNSSEWIVENFETKAKSNVDNIIHAFAKRLPTPRTTQPFICYQKIDKVLAQ